ncbi:MAG: hypothetical protein RH917_12680 [Lacipirellulaceae bacterium]
MYSIRRVSLLVLSCVILLTDNASAAFPSRIVARTRGFNEFSVPQVLGGGRFVDIETFSFNGQGDLLFAGPGSTFGRGGIWRVEPTGPVVQTFSLDETTSPGLRLDRINESSVSVGSGGTAFLANSDNVFGPWIDPTDGAPQLIASASRDEPTIGPRLGPGVVFQTVDPQTQFPSNEAFLGLVINDSNIAAFRGQLRGTNINFRNDRGIWLWDEGQLRVIARGGTAGAQGPQLADGSLFGNFNSRLHIDNQGRVGFSANADSTVGVWQFDGAMNVPIVVSGTDGPLGPGLGAGVEIANASLFGMTNDGVMAIAGQLDDASRTGYIIRADGQSKEVIAMAGTNGPMGPGFGNETWRFVGTPAIASNGQMSFSGQLSQSGSALWKLTPSGVEPFATQTLSGPLGPGLGDGVAFSVFVGDHTINSSGQTAFMARLGGVGIDSTNNFGLWAHHEGRNVLIARKGDLVDTDPTEAELFKTVADIHTFGFFGSLQRSGSLQASGGEGGAVRWLNDAGELAYLLEFTDGSVGLFVAKIPEPTTLMVALVMVLTGVGSRSRGHQSR